MNIYDYEIVPTAIKPVKSSTFLPEDIQKIVDFNKGKSDEDAIYFICLNDDPRFQLWATISCSLQVDYPSSKNEEVYHDTFLGFSIVLPRVRDGKPGRIEICNEFISEFTDKKTLKAYLKKFSGYPYITHEPEIPFYYNNRFNARESILVPTVNMLYGMSYEELAEELDLDSFNIL